MQHKKITVEQLDALKDPTLEDILALVNNGKYGKFFRDRPYEFSDGSRECMTLEGVRAYGRLTSILFACGGLAGNDELRASMCDIVDRLDGIAEEVS